LAGCPNFTGSYSLRCARAGERVRTREGNPVRPEDLGGIAEGSEIYVEDNYVSVLEYVKDKHRRE